MIRHLLLTALLLAQLVTLHAAPSPDSRIIIASEAGASSIVMSPKAAAP